jgi:hypothetical protein
MARTYDLKKPTAVLGRDFGGLARNIKLELSAIW